MQRNIEKCREMQRKAEKCREMQKNAAKIQKYREMQIHVKKCGIFFSPERVCGLGGGGPLRTEVKKICKNTIFHL